MVRSSGSRQGCCTTPRRASTAWQPSSFSSSSSSSSSFSSCSADDQGSSKRKSPGEISRGEITAGASDAKLGMTNLTPIVPNSLPKTTGFEGSSSKETDFFRDLLCLHKHVKTPGFLCSQRYAHAAPSLGWRSPLRFFKWRPDPRNLEADNEKSADSSKHPLYFNLTACS